MAQPSKRSALTTLTRVRLLELADLFELELPRAAAKGELIEALAHSKRASFSKLLDALKREELKDICRAHGLDDGGRDRILGTDADDAPVEAQGTPAPASQLSMLAPDPTQPRRPSERSVLAPLTRDRLADLAETLDTLRSPRARDESPGSTSGPR